MRSRAADIASQTGISIKTKNRIPHGLAQKLSLAQKPSRPNKQSGDCGWATQFPKL